MNSDSRNSNWLKRQIGDFCAVGDGAHASIKRYEQGIMYLTSKNFKSGGLDLSKIDYISESDYAKYFKKDAKALTKPEAGDVLFSIIGTIGEPYLFQSQDCFGLSSSVSILRPDKSIIFPKYLFYWIQGHIFQNALYSIKGGVAQSYVSLEMIKSLPLICPPIPTQQKITDILSAYDDLIENNAKRIKTLEEMARMLYREWFINFRFPNHENVKMVESDLGLIPEGWEVVELIKLIDVKHGYAFKGEYFSKEPTYDILLTPTNFAIGGGFKDDKFKYYLGEVPNDYILKPNDLLVTMTDLSKLGDTLGYPALIPDSKTHRFLHNQRLGKIIIHNTKLIGKNLLYYIFRSDLYRHHVLASATGSTVKHTAPDRIKSFKIVLPSTAIRQNFENITDLQLNQIEILKRKNINLRKTRDLLLPKLISGEIDVEKLDIETLEIAA